jgi:hypothetical protein
MRAARGSPISPRAQHELAEDQLEERGLADAIATDDADLGVLRQADGRLVEKPAAPGVEHKVFDLKAYRNREREMGADQPAPDLRIRDTPRDEEPRRRLTWRLLSRRNRPRHADPRRLLQRSALATAGRGAIEPATSRLAAQIPNRLTTQRDT